MTTASQAVATEISRRMTNRERVGIFLKRHGSATTLDLIDVGGLRAAARIHELRERGWVITSEPITGGMVRYTLVSAGATS